MHSGCDDECMLKLQCRRCEQKFYWGSVYHGVSCLTKCPSCKVEGSKHFEVLKRIYEGIKA